MCLYVTTPKFSYQQNGRSKNVIPHIVTKVILTMPELKVLHAVQLSQLGFPGTYGASNYRQY